MNKITGQYEDLIRLRNYCYQSKDCASLDTLCGLSVCDIVIMLLLVIIAYSVIYIILRRKGIIKVNKG